MAGAKIQAANFAVREVIPEMRRVANENPNAQVLVRAIAFADGARWHVAQPTPISSFQWSDMQAGGVTDMGKALRMLADVLTVEQMPSRGLPPVLVLLSDGRPTDDFNRGLKALMEQPWGKKAVRIAIAVGDDVDLDVLQKFIGHGELAPLQAHNANELVNYIKWASTAMLQAASSPATQSTAPAIPSAASSVAALNVPLPTPPPPTPATDDEDVW
jgi:uncharacterized protein YegL